jgi:DNA polymerase-3 subunit gamma/tau
VKTVRPTLYLKYRPRRFSELVGQEVIARALRHAVREGRIGHAYLFTGVRGTGKTSAARILARAINCLSPEDGEPCLACGPCVSIGEGRSLDVIEIDAATNRGIDEIRDLRERAQFLPSELRTKVYIIDEAHMLTNEAGNAFLKTLEEPPPHACFILATTEPQRLSETILSRCQRFDFRRIPAGAMAEHLQSICDQEGVTTSRPVMDLVAEAGAGSLRDAESLLERLMGLDDGVLELDTVRSALGMADPAAVAGLAESLVERRPRAVLERLGQLQEYGVEPRQLLRALGVRARDSYWRLAEKGEGAGPWLELMDACTRGASELRRADDPWMTMEVVLLQVASVSASARPEGPVSRAEAAPAPHRRAGIQSERPLPPASPSKAGDGPPASSPPPATASRRELDTMAGELSRESSGSPVPDPGPRPSAGPEPDWRALWMRVVEWAREHHKPFHALVLDTTPTGVSNGSLIVEVNYEWHLGQLNSPANRELLSQALQTAAGREIPVTLVLRGSAGPTPGSGGGSRGGQGLAAALKHFPGSTVRKVDFLDPRPR